MSYPLLRLVRELWRRAGSTAPTFAAVEEAGQRARAAATRKVRTCECSMGCSNCCDDAATTRLRSHARRGPFKGDIRDVCDVCVEHYTHNNHKKDPAWDWRPEPLP